MQAAAADPIKEQETERDIRYKQFLAQYQAEINRQSATARTALPEPQNSNAPAVVKAEEQEGHEVPADEPAEEFEFEDVLPPKAEPDGVPTAILVGLAQLLRVISRWIYADLAADQDPAAAGEEGDDDLEWEDA